MGVAPGFAGLYQINFRVPEDAENSPQVRAAIGERLSLEGLRLFVGK